MKRFALIVLIFSLILSQFGCSELFADRPVPNTLPVTDPERIMLREYYEAMCMLNNYVKYGFAKFYGKDRVYYDTEALVRYHEYFKGLEEKGFDELVARDDVKGYIREYFYENVNWDRHAVIRRFFALEDMKIKETRVAWDKFGNINRNAECSWVYEKNGNIQQESDANNFFEQIETNPLEIGGYRTYYRDEEGKVTQIKYVELTYGNVEALVTPVYDELGRVIREEVQQKVNLVYVDYSYDEAGRLTTIQANRPDQLTICYTYDDQGRVLKEEKTYLELVRNIRYVKTMEYTYDENGYLLQGVYRYEAWAPEDMFADEDGEVLRYLWWDQENLHDYQCDEEGKLISNTVTYGDKIFRSGEQMGQIAAPSSYSTAVFTFTYGDVLLYRDHD